MNTFKGRQLRELARRRELLYFKRTGVKKIAFPLVIASRNTICCTGAWRINLSKYSFMPVRGARNAAQSSQKDDERRFKPTIYPDTKRRLSRSFTWKTQVQWLPPNAFYRRVVDNFHRKDSFYFSFPHTPLQLPPTMTRTQNTASISLDEKARIVGGEYFSRLFTPIPLTSLSLLFFSLYLSVE